VRVPSFNRFLHWTRTVGLILLGSVIGGSIVIGIHHHNLNTIITNNVMLKEQIRELTKDIEALNEMKNQHAKIATIKVAIENPEDEDKILNEITKNKIKKEIEKKLRSLVGQKTTAIDSPKLYRVLINGWYPMIDEKDYTVTFSMVMIVQSELKVWVKAEEYMRN
jgi:hypothetical protein